ncbi:MAG: hypothetical protein ACFFBR_06765 [Promethearchaeota archaeon]
MGTHDSAQTLTIIGIVCNGFILLFEFLLSLVFFPYMFLTMIWFVVGIVLPIIAYSDIPKGNRGSAGALLIISGIISLIFIFLIGGILLIVAGALVASSGPAPSTERYYDLRYVQSPSSSHGTAYLVPPRNVGTKKCVNCGADLDRVDQYCHVCGTNVGWY